ncbi:MAG: aldose 1-epimerase family protein [Selenomonadaceae bacterium]|nr:aldose 1-epimerase family protein [Selenomonadaceae bacterium]
MTHTLDNGTLKITVDEHGAELKSLVKGDTDFICSGTEFWKYSSPILFPIVGKLKDDTFRFGGKNYSLPSHGFGRLSDFVCVDENPLTFKLTFSDDTLKNYPFKFALTVTYTLDENQLKINWRVENLDDKTIYFSIGAHPALTVPFDGGNFDDYQLEFDQSENSARIPLTGGLLSDERIPTIDGKILKLNYDLFKGDALIFDNLKSSEITIRRDKKSVTLKAEGFPFWGIWTKVGAPFVCLEPWHGHADFANFDGDLTEKDGIVALEVGKIFTSGYSIIVDA